ncbi:MAG: S8 family serine peptidase, partial [Bacteroidetes bacterium]|nr:S8 family serine peptidase [Bacteroidota bacterium]
ELTKYLYLYRLTFLDTSSTEFFIDDLMQINSVEYVEKVPANYSFVNDPMYSSQDYLSLLNAQGVWDIHTGGNAIVAIVDDAVLITHEDLAGNINNINRNVTVDITNPNYNTLSQNPNPVSGGQFPSNGNLWSHGTHVAGIAGAVTNNGYGIASLGRNNIIMAVRAQEHAFSNINFGYEGIAWAAANGAHVINCSWGSYVLSKTNYDLIVDVRYRVDPSQNQNGIIIVAAAGNDNVNLPTFPAAYGTNNMGDWYQYTNNIIVPINEVYDKSLVIAVAALDNDNNKAIYSNYGSWIDIATYGNNINSTIANSSGGLPINNEFGVKSGTSMAAPIVSGLAGLMKSYDMTKSASEIIECIFLTANPDIYMIVQLNHTEYIHPNKRNLGNGRLNALDALKCMGVPCNKDPIAIINPSRLFICPGTGGSVTLTANQGIAYEWSTGETSQSIVKNQPGNYSVIVTFTGGCTAETTINIQEADLNAEITFTEFSGLAPND